MMKRNKWLAVFLVVCAGLLVMAMNPGVFLHAEEAAEAAGNSAGAIRGSNIAFMALSAMGAVSLSCISSGYALARIGSAALGAMSEKPEIGGRALVFLGMAEGIAIYGLIIAIMMLNKI